MSSQIQLMLGKHLVSSRLRRWRMCLLAGQCPLLHHSLGLSTHVLQIVILSLRRTRRFFDWPVGSYGGGIFFFYYQRFMSAYISSYRKLCVRHRANTRRKAEVITLGKRSICGLCARRTRWNKITGKYVSPSMEIMLKHSKWKITLGINENDIEQSNSGVLVDVWRI